MQTDPNSGRGQNQSVPLPSTFNGKPVRGRAVLAIAVTPGLPPEELARRADLASQVLYLARNLTVGGKPHDWLAVATAVGLSTMELLAVAMVLDDHAALRRLGFTMVGALDRLSDDLGLAELRAISKAL